MTLKEHHDWVVQAASGLVLGGDTLWQAMCATWATKLDVPEHEPIVRSVQDAVDGIPWSAPAPTLRLPRSVAIKKPLEAPTFWEGEPAS